MARIKNNFTVTREQLEVIIDALGKAECWMVYREDLDPDFKKLYDEEVERFIDLELMLGKLLNKFIA